MTRFQFTRVPLLTLGIVAMAAGCTDKTMVAKVGNRVILQADIPEYRRLSGAPTVSDSDTLEQIILRERLAAKAEAMGLHQRPEIQARLRAAQREVLAQAALATHLETITEEIALQHFQKDKDAYALRSVRAAHIVCLVPPGAKPADVETARSRATKAWASLLGGADFAEVARSTSEDPATSSKGGEIGLIREGEIAQPLFDQLMQLKEGGYTKPLEGPSGFHVFKALSAPTRVVPEFDTIKGKVVAELRRKAEQEFREQLKQEISVQRYPETLNEKVSTHSP